MARVTSFNQEKLTTLVKTLYKVVNELEQMFPGRHFTPDGHVVGSLGETLVADAYGLQLEEASNRGFDATTPDGTEVEIKATQARSVGFRSKPAHAIVIKIYKDGTFDEIFNGPGALIWDQFEGKKSQSNGQYQISVSKLQELNSKVGSEDKISRVA